MSTFNASIDGLDSLMSKLSEMGDTACLVATKAIETGARVIEGEAVLNVAVDTGYLRESIGTEAEDKGGTAVAEVYATAEYAPYVELGTGQRGEETNKNSDVSVSYTMERNGKPYMGQPAQPFMYPAFVTGKEAATAQTVKVIREELTKW